MRLVACEAGLIITLEALITTIPILVFPFQNDRSPIWSDDVTLYTEANFSGYAGAQNVAGFAAIAVGDQRAIVTAAPVEFRHDGGPVENNIFGFCFVDSFNQLLFAVRLTGAPFLCSPASRIFSVTPQLSTIPEFPGP